jgi:hypothetical protein
METETLEETLREAIRLTKAHAIELTIEADRARRHLIMMERLLQRAINNDWQLPAESFVPPINDE